MFFAMMLQTLTVPLSKPPSARRKQRNRTERKTSYREKSETDDKSEKIIKGRNSKNWDDKNKRMRVNQGGKEVFSETMPLPAKD